MKRHFKGHRPIALITLIANSIRLLLAMPLLALALACPKPIIPPEPEIPPPPPPPEPGIVALVKAVPGPVEVFFGGESIGHTPAQMKVHSVDQLSDGLTVADMPDGAVEQRISIITETEVEVTLVFDREKSQMAKALNLAKILVFDYGEEITFDYNQSELKPNFKPLLVKQAKLLNEYFSGIDVYICGHSDARGRRERNLELSLARALSVYEELLAAGVPKASMKIQGFGSDFPLAPNDTETGRARNRRIEIVLGR
jgi:outer membrane protein OmpA-like peptidoglycan-associated protein